MLRRVDERQGGQAQRLNDQADDDVRLPPAPAEEREAVGNRADEKFEDERQKNNRPHQADDLLGHAGADHVMFVEIKEIGDDDALDRV